MSTAPDAGAPPRSARRARVVVRGVVQGVGFRPFVYGLASELGLAGHVTNTGDGVVAEVEGPVRAVDLFCARLAPGAPPLAIVESVEASEVPATGGSGFRIAPSRGGDQVRTLVAPDTATCHDCLAELADPADRRHRHPFITCTHCGPRFTIVTGTDSGIPLQCAEKLAGRRAQALRKQPAWRARARRDARRAG